MGMSYDRLFRESWLPYNEVGLITLTKRSYAQPWWNKKNNLSVSGFDFEELKTNYERYAFKERFFPLEEN